MAEGSLFERLGGVYAISGAVDVLVEAVALEIAATLTFLGVPSAEHKEFMEIIESYRPQVVTAS